MHYLIAVLLSVSIFAIPAFFNGNHTNFIEFAQNHEWYQWVLLIFASMGATLVGLLYKMWKDSV